MAGLYLKPTNAPRAPSEATIIAIAPIGDSGVTNNDTARIEALSDGMHS